MVWDCIAAGIYAKAQEVRKLCLNSLRRSSVPEGLCDRALNPDVRPCMGKLYVAIFMEEKSACGCLQELQAILVKGCASLPSSRAKPSVAISRADSYRFMRAISVRINGWEYFSHERLKTMVDRGEKITLRSMACWFR